MLVLLENEKINPKVSAAEAKITWANTIVNVLFKYFRFSSPDTNAKVIQTSVTIGNTLAPMFCNLKYKKPN